MKKVVIASACRTAIGKFGGTLANVPAAELGSIVIKEALDRANVKPEQVDHVYMGCVIQAGLGQNVARQAALKAGLPIETPAVTVNVVCGSGLNCVNMAAQMIEAGDADIVVAGGMENMDMAPFALQKARYGYRMGAPMGMEIFMMVISFLPLFCQGDQHNPSILLTSHTLDISLLYKIIHSDRQCTHSHIQFSGYC